MTPASTSVATQDEMALRPGDTVLGDRGHVVVLETKPNLVTEPVSSPVRGDIVEVREGRGGIEVLYLKVVDGPSTKGYWCGVDPGGEYVSFYRGKDRRFYQVMGWTLSPSWQGQNPWRYS